jgi:aldose 1-epimerase
LGRESASTYDFGTLSDGQTVSAIRLVNRRGLTATIITYGASIQSVCVPDRHGVIADVTTGYATLADYVDQPQFFGATVGRVANRIAGGRFSLDGREYHVPANDGANSLHGGPCGFDKVNWAVVETLESATAQSVTLRHISPYAGAGYPGTLTVTATYCLDDSNALSVHYTATTDAPTVCNLSNHAYWNLGGEGSAHGAMDHELTIFADAYLPVDAALIPTGEVRAVAGTVFDFRTPTAIGARVRDATEAQLRHGRGYDHNWVLDAASGEGPRPIAHLADPRSDRTMTILSNQPGLQFYSGNFFDGSTAGKAGKFYRMGDAVALEPQRFPDTPNQPAFGSIRLDPGEAYSNIIIWRFGTMDQE